MRQVPRWEANDGSIWKYEKDAKARDSLIKSMSWFDKLLPPAKDETCRFSTGHGFVQRNASVVKKAKEKLIMLTEKQIPEWFKTQREKHKTDFTKVHSSWFLRMIEGNAPPLSHAWLRLGCIDDRYREWGQPYYASHPDKGEQVEWKGGQ